jgi:hypothetical protein
MKKQLLRKISTYLPVNMTLMSLAFGMLFSTSANAQFVYTDVNPDVIKSCTGVCTQIDSVDINNDGVFDLKLVLTKSGGSGSVKATPLNGCAILDNSGFPGKLYRNDSINPSSNWSMNANQTLSAVIPSGPMGGFNYSGNWGPSIDGFLGIRIVSGIETLYGWIRLNVGGGASGSFTYKEFAYNSISDQAILAGQTTDTIIIGPIVNIPDAAFKVRLVHNAAINTDIDREIQVTEAAAFTGQLNISASGSNSPISNLTGIEAFTALTYLNCLGNNLTSLDFSGNTALTFLNCGYNDLTSLNVSANAALESIYCQNNQLTNIDVSANNALFTFNCNNNLLTSIDVSSNSNLGQFYCDNNLLTNLDFSSNTLLNTLYCNNNQLTSLNFLSSVDYLECEYNQLTSLDVSANTALWRLLCNNNQLTSLNVKNGNNINFNAFDARYNPNLLCIEVDNVAYSNSNWSAGKDATASFSTNCGVTAVSSIDKAATINLFPNPANNHLSIELGSIHPKVDVTITDITGKIIYSTSATNTEKIEVNAKDFAAGVYLVQIQSADFIATKKLVVEK